MLELRKLFSLLLGSQRKYVDPSVAVGILRGCLGGENYCNNQQDVSEFTHRLLDWLEEAFKIRDKCAADVLGDTQAKETEAMDSDTEKCDKEKDVGQEEDKAEPLAAGRNPMYDLFYGRVKIEGKNQGIEFSREEQFGQWPLQVNNFSDIHDSLEASTAHEYIDTSSQSDLSGLPAQHHSVRKSGQERWFTALPPVLFLELSRFQYNQERGMAEKINNFLDFPEVIYMDRYLEVNKNVTRSKREEVKKLKEQREKLKSQLQAYLEYGTDSSLKIPLVSVLNRTMQFARSGTESLSGDEPTLNIRDTDMSSPSNNSMQVDSPCPSPASLTPASSMVNLNAPSKSELSPLHVLPDGSVQIPIKIETVDKNAPVPMEVESCVELQDAKIQSPAKQGLVNCPTPRYVSELELKVLSSCLTRWRQEIEEDLSSLNSSLQEVETKIQEMYNTPALTNNGYRLHAVMVHEGDVNQGHYWAYVYHPVRKVWLKFNDNSVSETTWKAMKKESAGGRMSTSAYSMVYIDMSRPDLIRPRDTSFHDNGGATRESLPADLEQYIQDDNKQFAKEILAWDEHLERKSKEADLTEGVLIGDDPECQIIESKKDLSTSHAMLAQDATARVISSISSSGMERKKPSETLNTFIAEIFANACKKSKEGDSKLESFLHYLISVEAGTEVIKRAAAEQVSLPSLDTSSDLARQVLNEARESLRKFPSAEETAKWHKAYHNFRSVQFN